MATINFLYRSSKDKAALNIRLLFRHVDKDYVIGSRIKLKVSKEYWKKYHYQKSPKDISIKNMQVDVKKELNNIEEFVIGEFDKANVEEVDKVWLENTLDEYYNPTKNSKSYSDELLKYFDYYLGIREKELAIQTFKNYKVVRKMLDSFECSIKRRHLVKDVDMEFKNDFENFCLGLGYAPNTIARAVQSLKSVCNHARFNGIETSVQLERVRSREERAKHIYLSFAELERIKNLDGKQLSESFINVRDWLIISCYTAQRYSDFIRFKKDLIRYEKGKPLIEFRQQKTGKLMTVPLFPEVIEVLGKRDGEFPKPISSQKYNSYLKEVCRIAGINDIVEGAKVEKQGEGKNAKYRKVQGKYEKWELCSSHIGRRSFATNYYGGEMPTALLIYMTGHSTEAMYLRYVGKSNKDMAIEIMKYI